MSYLSRLPCQRLIQGVGWSAWLATPFTSSFQYGEHYVTSLGSHPHEIFGLAPACREDSMSLTIQFLYPPRKVGIVQEFK